MNRQEITDSSSLEEYLQISMNILETFPSRLPVTLYINDEEINRIVKLFEKDTRLTRVKNDEVIKRCEENNLFVSRSGYQDFASHLSKHLGALLTEHYLDEADAANIFYRGIREVVAEFFGHPINQVLREVKKNLAIFCEYMWVDPARWISFFHALNKDEALSCHAVNTLFVGMALYLQSSGENANQEDLNMGDLALGLVLHDLGMTQLPAALKEKTGPLIFSEKSRVKEHIDMGVKMLDRIEEDSEDVRICMTQHHERLDGSGYPAGFREDRLAKPARICAVADVFCAMIAKRRYREAINPLISAMALMEDQKRFDPSLTKLLLEFILKGSKDLRALFKERDKIAKFKALARREAAKNR